MPVAKVRNGQLRHHRCGGLRLHDRDDPRRRAGRSDLRALVRHDDQPAEWRNPDARRAERERVGGSPIPEIFNSETGFRALTGAEITDMNGDWWYPHAWVNSRGEVIILETGGGDIYRMTTDGLGTVAKIGTMDFASSTPQPSIMFAQDMVARIGNDGGIYVANIADAVPTFTMVAQLDGSRPDAGMVILPDGTIAITGGTDGGTQRDHGFEPRWRTQTMTRSSGTRRITA